MIVDFQHHFTPRELIQGDVGDRRVTQFDKNGVPRYTAHALLYDLDEHIRMMDEAGIDVAVLTSAAGMCADLETSRLINRRAREAEQKYPRRFIGAAHAHPLGGAEAMAELKRCAQEYGFPGVVITSEFDGLWLDDPQLEPFWSEVERLGLYVFVHPALKLNDSRQFNLYDTARSVGREFSLIMVVVRLVNSGILDRHPSLTIHMAHLGGGIASMLGRIRSFQHKEFWGTAGNPQHGLKAEKEFDWYIRNRFVFDTAGFAGDMGAVRAALAELPAERIVFAADYPQEIRTREAVRAFVQNIRALGPAGERILSGNVNLLLRGKAILSS